MLLLPEDIDFERKIPIAGTGYLSMSCLPVKIVIVLGRPPELDDNTLLVKTSPILDTGQREIRLELT